MSDKPAKFYNNPLVVLGLMVALIVVVAAVMYLFYTKLATSKAKLDDASKRIDQLKSEVASARTKAEVGEKLVSKVSDLENKVNALDSKLKKMKGGQTPQKKMKCSEDGSSCEIQDL